MSEQNKNLESWMVATSAALQSLAAYFPATGSHNGNALEERWRISTRLFPCQKDDGTLCRGWMFVSAQPGLGAQETEFCPCARGQNAFFLSLLELAREFSEGFVFPKHPPSRLPSAFVRVHSHSDFLFHALRWMFWAAQMGFPSQQHGGWIEQFEGKPLTTHQRQALRWWGRLVELNRLLNNRVFSLVTQRGVQELFKKGQTVAVSEAFERMGVTENTLVVLCLGGDSLRIQGQHSQAQAWFDSFISCVDNAGAGLCLISGQPLFDGPSSLGLPQQPSSGSYRWKVRRQPSDQLQPFERVLRRGIWDRLIELLARGELIIKASKSFSSSS